MINIRIATTEDRDAIELLTRLLVSDRNEVFDPKRFEWGLLRRLFDPLQRHGIFIAEEIEDSGEPIKKTIGMIFSELRVDPFGYSEGYIKQFYVRPQNRNKGIGTKLLHAVINHLKKLDVQIIKVNVKPGAEETFRMYSQLDFQTKYTCMQLNLKDNNGEKVKDESLNFELDNDTQCNE